LIVLLRLLLVGYLGPESTFPRAIPPATARPFLETKFAERRPRAFFEDLHASRPFSVSAAVRESALAKGLRVDRDHVVPARPSSLLNNPVFQAFSSEFQVIAVL
jgi:hypothetical protein